MVFTRALIFINFVRSLFALPTNVSANDHADTTLQTDELINAVLPRVSCCLDEAGNAWTDNDFGDACAHLGEAVSLLQALSSAVLPDPVIPLPQTKLSPLFKDRVDTNVETDWMQLLAITA